MPLHHLLKEIEVTILRRQGNEVIVSGAPIDKEYVMQRSPQLGNGLKIKPLRKKDREISNSKSLSNNNDLVTLSPEKQNKLIKFFGFKDYVLDVLIVGGGNIGQNLSTLIEQDDQEINLKILEYQIKNKKFFYRLLLN